LLQANTGNYVLRKKPPPPTLPSAHAIEREFQVIHALGPTPVPVPRAIHLCENISIIGTPFYLMAHVQGRIFEDPALPGLSPQQRSSIYAAMASTLAQLHNVVPSSVNLQNYGPSSQYNRRQVTRWSRQYISSVSKAETPMPEMVALSEQLQGRIPSTDNDPTVTRISHGDYRLDNLVFDPEKDSTILAVLDWELSTLGDPLADVAYNCLPYHLYECAQQIPNLPALPRPLPEGIPTEQQYIKMYCNARGLEYPLKADWPFYLALALFRLASILAGVGARARAGNASSRIAAEMGADSVVRSLASQALSILDSKDIDGNTNNNYEAASNIVSRDQTAPPGLGPSEKVKSILERLHKFMSEKIIPAEPVLDAHAASDIRWTIHPLQEQLKKEAKRAGLWNLWLPADMATKLKPLVESENISGNEEISLLLGPGLSNLEYAHCAEVMGRCVWASEIFNCSAPDTGNMEVLARYGSPAQQRQWLIPLLRGDIRSCFAMTEPAVASSDATNIQSSISRRNSDENSHYIIQGKKWWISGANDPRCAIAIFMGKTDPHAATHSQQSMILVPMNTPGIRIIRPLPVFGFDDAPHGHAEIELNNVIVPAENLILGEGRGFEIAQGRLGPGRLHHCMRVIGMGERSLELLVARAMERKAFGKQLAGHQSVRVDIAKSRIELNAARLAVLEAARALDEIGNKAARGHIAAAKAMAPSTVLTIIDRAIQVHGGAGVSDVTPLAGLWAAVRTLRLADGPDIVHLETVAKLELSKAAKRRAKL
jgi:acyl-CoA dehydrogenase